MSGKQLEHEVELLGVTDADFAVEADISEPTLREIYRDNPRIKPVTRNKALRALERLKAQRIAG